MKQIIICPFCRSPAIHTTIQNIKRVCYNRGKEKTVYTYCSNCNGKFYLSINRDDFPEIRYPEED